MKKPFSSHKLEKALPKTREQEIKESISRWQFMIDAKELPLAQRRNAQDNQDLLKAELKGIAEGRIEASKQFAEWLMPFKTNEYLLTDISLMRTLVKEKIRELEGGKE